MMEKELELGKLDIKMSTMIKGIAIILMVMHHSFGFPDDWINGVEYNTLILGEPINEWIRWTTKICVAIFAFITGYAYFFNKNQNLKYSLKKIWKLLQKYWFILLLIFLPISLYVGVKKITLKVIFYNIIAQEITTKRIIPSAWYVYFYIIVMLLMPFIKKCFNGKWMTDFLIPITICACLYNLVDMADLDSNLKWLRTDLNNILLYMPCVIYGFLFAKYSTFEKLDKYFKPKYLWQSILVIFIIFGCALNWNKLFGINMYTIYVPIFIYECMIILNNLKYNIILKVLEFLGKHSLNIWFLHSIFLSGYTSTLMQPIGFLPKNIILVVIWEILLCIPISIVINFIFNIINKFIKNKGGKINEKS